MRGGLVARRPIFDQLYNAYLVFLAVLPMIAISVDAEHAGTLDPGAVTHLAAVGLPVVLAAWAVISGRRGAPLLIDRATMLVKTRTPHSNGVALAGDVVTHLGSIVGMTVIAGLLVAPELGRGGAWSSDVALRVVALVGLAAAAFGLALAMSGPLVSVRVIFSCSVFAAVSVVWAGAVHRPEASGWLAFAALLAAMVSVVASTGALEHLDPDRLVARARVVEDLRMGWMMMTPMQVIAMLRAAGATTGGRSRWSRRWRRSLRRWTIPIALALSVVAATTMIGGAPLRVGMALGVLTYLLGGEILIRLTLLAGFSRQAPLTVANRHIIVRALAAWVVVVTIGAAGAALIAWSSSDTGATIGVALASIGAGGCCALWSSVGRQLDHGSAFAHGGPELVGMVTGARWVLPPLGSVMIAVSAATASSPDGLVMAVPALIAVIAAVTVLPLVAVRP